MQHLAEKVMTYASGLPEGRPIAAKELLHLGKRAAVDQVLSRLIRRGSLMKAGRGVYVRPVDGKFGARAPLVSKLIEQFALQRGEVIAEHGAVAANRLGLTTQVPVREVYLTSGAGRHLTLGAQPIELRHVPEWQLLLPRKAAGDVLRVLAWLGEEKASAVLHQLKNNLTAEEIEELSGLRVRLPEWVAELVSRLMND